MEDFEEVNINGVKVFYKKKHDGGGIKFHRAFIDRLKLERKQSYKRCMEFASGPGFIGFSLLAEGVIDELVFVDVNKSVFEGVEITLKENNLDVEKVKMFEANWGDQSFIEKIGTCDLVVSNPPHIDVVNPDTGKIPYDDHPIIYSDPDFSIHRNFFNYAKSFLSDDGLILFIENAHFSSLSQIIGNESFSGLKFSHEDEVLSGSTKLSGKYWLIVRRG